MHAPPVEALQDRCFIPTTAVCTPRMCLRKPAVTLVSLKSMGSVGTSADNAFASVV